MLDQSADDARAHALFPRLSLTPSLLPHFHERRDGVLHDQLHHALVVHAVLAARRVQRRIARRYDGQAANARRGQSGQVLQKERPRGLHLALQARKGLLPGEHRGGRTVRVGGESHHGENALQNLARGGVELD